VWFLLAYWLYIDGVNTVIKMAIDFGLSLGFPQQSLIAALLITQFVGFPAALAFGWLGNRIGARNGIFIAIAVYAAATVAAYWMSEVAHILRPRGRHRLVQGGIQSLSRSYYADAGAGGQAGRVLRLLQHDGKVRGRARPDDGRHHGARHAQHARAACCRSSCCSSGARSCSLA
jgi:UMF1 family MFS transporter